MRGLPTASLHAENAPSGKLRKACMQPKRKQPFLPTPQTRLSPVHGTRHARCLCKPPRAILLQLEDRQGSICLHHGLWTWWDQQWLPALYRVGAWAYSNTCLTSVACSHRPCCDTCMQAMKTQFKMVPPPRAWSTSVRRCVGKWGGGVNREGGSEVLRVEQGGCTALCSCRDFVWPLWHPCLGCFFSQVRIITDPHCRLG